MLKLQMNGLLNKLLNKMSELVQPNYLNHKLIQFTKYCVKDDYKCLACGIEIYHERSDNTYWIINNDGEAADYSCELTCNEYIIKQIIE